MSRRGSTSSLWMFWLLVCVTSALLFTLNYSAPDSPLRSDQPQPPVVVSSVQTESLSRQPADLTLTWGPAPLLYWPGAAGVITDVPVESGVVESGDVVAVVDSTPIIALHTPRPLYRDITAGSRGPDVQQLAEELNRLGLLAVENITDRADQDLREAVQVLNERAGLNSSELRLAGVVWLPEIEFDIENVEISVGKAAPVSGETLAAGRTPLVKATATAPEGAAEQLERLPDPVQIRIAGLVIPLDDELSAIDTAPIEAATSSAAGELTGGLIELVVPVVAWKLPATAVIAGSDGSTCVVTPSGETIKVTVSASGPGEVEVIGESPPEVVSNPVDSGVANDCG